MAWTILKVGRKRDRCLFDKRFWIWSGRIQTDTPRCVLIESILPRILILLTSCV